MSEKQRLSSALSLIFVGELFCIININIGIDMINDVIGVGMVIRGVYQIGKLGRGERFTKTHRVLMGILFVRLGLILYFEVLNLNRFYIYGARPNDAYVLPEIAHVLESAKHLSSGLSFWAICIFMRWFSESKGYSFWASRWQGNSKVILWTLVIPTFLVHVVGNLILLELKGMDRQDLVGFLILAGLIVVYGMLIFLYEVKKFQKHFGAGPSPPSPRKRRTSSPVERKNFFGHLNSTKTD